MLRQQKWRHVLGVYSAFLQSGRASVLRFSSGGGVHPETDGQVFVFKMPNLAPAMKTARYDGIDLSLINGRLVVAFVEPWMCTFRPDGVQL